MTRQTQARVTHGQFYAICQWLKNHADLATPTTQGALAIEASKHLGFPITASTIADGLKAAGLAYTPTAAATRQNQTSRSNDSIVLARAIGVLCVKLGEPLPPGIAEIAMTGRTE